MTVSERETLNLTWLGEFPSNSWFSYGIERGGIQRRRRSHYSLGPALVQGASDGRVWLGDTGTGIIGVYDVNGMLVSQFEFPMPSRAFDEAALEAKRIAALSSVPVPDETGMRSRISTLYSSELRPATAPRFSNLTTGPDGEMWVECFSETNTDEHCVVVLNHVGLEIGRTTVPVGLTLQAVDRDRIIGIVRDANGVERVAIHQLKR